MAGRQCKSPQPKLRALPFLGDRECSPVAAVSGTRIAYQSTWKRIMNMLMLPSFASVLLSMSPKT